LSKDFNGEAAARAEPCLRRAMPSACRAKMGAQAMGWNAKAGQAPDRPVAKEAQGLLARGRAVVRAELAGLARLAAAMEEGGDCGGASEGALARGFPLAAGLIARAPGRAVVCGLGKSGHIARKIAATMSATGCPALFLHAGEAAHGDLGMMAPGDVLLLLSQSGNTAELRAVLAHARRLGVACVAITGAAHSLLGEGADVALVLPRADEAGFAGGTPGWAPTTSAAMHMALGDALALAVMELRGVERAGLAALHPGGAIGLALTPVGELMHRDTLPLVPPAMPMREVIRVITGCRFGLAGVVDGAGALLGVITDGDLRRHVEVLGQTCAGAVMTGEARSLRADMTGEDALMLMNDAKITAAFVVEQGQPLGVLHIHDLLRRGLN
jgi:arabinose-5-phosphate isomerase